MKDNRTGGAASLMTPSKHTQLPHYYAHLVSHPGRTTLDASEC